MSNPKVNFQGETLTVMFDKYRAGGRIALDLVDGEGPFARATVNLPEVLLEPNEVLIKDWSENEGILKALVEAGVVEDTGRRVQAGHAEANVCRLLVWPSPEGQ